MAQSTERIVRLLERKGPHVPLNLAAPGEAQHVTR